MAPDSACVWLRWIYNRSMFRIIIAFVLLLVGFPRDLPGATQSKVSPTV
ncbi:MAG: hypothetical protein ACI91J_001625, partial [Yoonia sp.]